jgi:hypothetical protein
MDRSLADEAAIQQWFDATWTKVRGRALDNGWDSLSRPDQVLVAVGFLVDSCIGDGVWAIVNGVVEGNDEGLTVRMPAALDELGLPEFARHVRSIISLRSPTGSPRRDKTNWLRARRHWVDIENLCDVMEPGRHVVVLTRLYDWYHAQQGPSGEPNTTADSPREHGA